MKLAVMTYSPVAAGVQSRWNIPPEVLVTVPIVVVVPAESVAYRVTGTPFAFWGGNTLCWIMYSIHGPWSSSAIAGVPLSCGCELWSVTVPVISTEPPSAMPVCGAETVVALGPGPIA